MCYVGLHVCLMHAACVVSVIVLMRGGRTLSSRLASALKQGGVRAHGFVLVELFRSVKSSP